MSRTNIQHKLCVYTNNGNFLFSLDFDTKDKAVSVGKYLSKELAPAEVVYEYGNDCELFEEIEL